MTDFEEALYLYENASTAKLMVTAHRIRKKLHPGNVVTWLIDRNINITNVCVSRCRFCNFHCTPGSKDAYITTFEEYKQKIDELFEKGGKQILLQGGMHPELGLDYYCHLFRQLKSYQPKLKLHALGPPEIVHLAKIEKTGYEEVLQKLIKSGLDSLPGAGAEILCDEIRQQVSPAKATTEEWLNVMRAAHKMNLITSATMMFGHAETRTDRLKHMFKIKKVQDEKPAGSIGFISFIPWPFQDENTVLQRKFGIKNTISSEEYIRTIAISRIVLQNIPNIQASWLTVGVTTGQVCLYAGANDFGSIMIEENVVSSAGADYHLDAEAMQKAIKTAGFEPKLRNQEFKIRG
jgi:cyclic dehypoxanthinyl futalosine synthase